MSVGDNWHRKEKTVWIGKPLWDLVAQRAQREDCSIKEMVERMICTAIASERNGVKDETEQGRDGTVV